MPTPPLPTATGFWHYTYIVRDTSTGQWYGGKHSTRDLHDGYVGSGVWIRKHSDLSILSVEIQEFFSTSDEAYTAEAAMIPSGQWITDPLCMNFLVGGQSRNHPDEDNETTPSKDNKRRVDIWMEGSLFEALRLKAARRGMLIATYVRDVMIQDTGWKPEDGK